MASPVNETISEEELSLASQLRKLCTIYGEERRKTLNQSATILLRMGKLYIRKAEQSERMLQNLSFIRAGAKGAKVSSHMTKGQEQSERMLQKLSFIRASALLNGAKVRFQMTKRHSGREYADKILNELDQKVLHATKLADSKVSLLKISEAMIVQIRDMREQSKLQLAKSSNGDMQQDGRLQAEKRKILQIRHLAEKTCEDYKKLMQNIAAKCHAILGEAPCAFVLIGLGSMARKEITLYSDFEHVIALQNGVQDRKSYPDIQEYFRWFAVIFQIIMIGLGETFIRSVGVKSINDLYSGDGTKNWFFDVYTPCGIAFDGMVPHSCNNPLGRQESGKIRQHVVELIQPASSMAEFLTEDEHIKNGYYLKDVLTRTCMLYGDEKVYDAFLNYSRVILESDKVTQVVIDHLQKVARSLPKPANMDKGLSMRANAKTTIYRPVTANLSYLARVYDISSPTSFDIISELRQRDIIDDEVAHQLEFALAIACEIRQKIYEKAGHQRHWLWRESIVDLVGKSCAVDVLCYTKCLESATYTLLLKIKPNLENRQLFQQEYKKRLEMGRAEAYQMIGCLDEAEKMGEEYVNRPGEKDPMQCVRLARIYELQAQINQQRRLECLIKAEQLLHNILATTTESDTRVSLLGILAGIHQKRGNLTEMEKVNEEAVQLMGGNIYAIPNENKISEACQTAPDNAPETILSHVASLTNQLDRVKQHLSLAAESAHEVTTVPFLPKGPDIMERYTLRLGLAVNQNYSGMPWKTRETLSQLCQEMRTQNVDKLVCMHFGIQILTIQMRKEWAKDAILTLDFFLDANETRSMPEYEEILDRFVGVKLSLLQYVSDREKIIPKRIGLIKDAVQLCQSDTDGEQQVSFDLQHLAGAKFQEDSLSRHAAKLARKLWVIVNAEDLAHEDANEAIRLLCVLLVAVSPLVEKGANLQNAAEEDKLKVIDILEQHGWIYSLFNHFVNETQDSPFGR